MAITPATCVLLAACGGGVAVETSFGAPRVDAAPRTALATPQISADQATAEPTTARNNDAVGRARALALGANVVVEGLADAPAKILSPNQVTGRSFHIDSRRGKDTYDGRSASFSGGNSGPWQTLARVMQSDIGAGDSLVLACGSEWRETLKLPASGTASQPITVGAPDAGCGSVARPTIDGSVAIQPQAWTLHSGKIYKTLVDGPVWQVTSGVIGWNEAHHPNRGHLASDATSPYLTMAADGKTVTTNGRTVSTTLVTGPDLVLPKGTQMEAGLKVRARSNSWTLEEAVLSGATGNTLTLVSPTRYPLVAGWGYYLAGALWMLDSPGEWHYESTGRTLYVWLPNSEAPSAVISATLLSVGIDVDGLSNISIDGIAVRRVGVGVTMRNSTALQLRNSRIEDTAGIGIDAQASKSALFEANMIVRTGSDAISGHDDIGNQATGMVVRNNLVRDAGVSLNGEAVLSAPRRSRAAVRTGTNARITGNVIVNTGYLGIWPSAGSVIEDNFVYGACTVLDDCGGIYVSNAPNGSQIRRNTIVRSRGAAEGKPVNQRYTQAQGIYLDESAIDVIAEDNTVIDTDNGLHLHVSARNVIRNNRLFGNRNSQIWLQETRARDNANGDVWGNVVEGNQIAPVLPGSVGIRLQTKYASTQNFGRIEANRYYDRSAPVAVVSTSSGSLAYSFAQWQLAEGVSAGKSPDASGNAVSQSPFASFSVRAGNLVSNSYLQSSSAGWGHWNQTAPSGQLLREACPAGMCLRYQAGGSPGLITSPYFSVIAGQWYRLSIDLATEQDNQPVQLLVRRGGGGSNGYESLSSASLYFTAQRAWKRYSFVFQATKTINARDVATGGLGARVDIQGIEIGKAVSLANLELTQITPDSLSHTTTALINAGDSSINMPCPVAGTQPALCSAFRNLADDSAVAWPLAVRAYSAALLYAQLIELLDSDRDGIPDAGDACPNTPAGSAVNASGCGFSQR